MIDLTMFKDVTTFNTAVELANKNTLVNIMTSEFFNAASGNLTPTVAAIAASAFLGAAEYMVEDPEMFTLTMEAGLADITLTLDGTPYANEAVDIESIYCAMIEAGYMVDTKTVGDRFLEILGQRKESYSPALSEDGVCRRFGYAKILTSKLFIESIHALEATEFTKNERVQGWALRVKAKMGEKYDKAAYCLAGAIAMDANKAYVSEFKGDTRGREYQAACHGVNGQAGDRERALMDLVGVPTDYDRGQVMRLIKAEVEDMVTTGDRKVIAKLLAEARANPVDFIVYHLTANKDDNQVTEVVKPWSFVKAAFYLGELHMGQTPYIGMAVGLDAKCSGPQLGSLIVGDGIMAAACGFSQTKVDDAYMRGVTKLEAAGFQGWTRALVKKPFMGVFYGQGWAAFMVPNAKEGFTQEMWQLIHGADAVLGDKERAVAFRNAILASFGAKMMSVRMAITAFNNKELKEGARLSYNMPDGFRVKMNYRVKVNALGEAIEPGVECPTVVIRNNLMTHKLQNMAIKTRTVATAEFVRTAFVNLIQATDALLARLIIVNLKRLGAKHIVSVHDCFRVNVTETHLLEQAIKAAYIELFGSNNNQATADLPMGTDILALFFAGMNELVVNEEDRIEMSQFVGKANVRRFRSINGVKLVDLINDLGTTYYFAK